LEFLYFCAENIIAMEKKLIGRNAEYKALTNYFTSKGSEFIAVYGRRRVGKTFLIRKAANDQFAFFLTGAHEVPKNEQLINFAIAVQKHFKTERLEIPKNWILAFYELSKHLESLPQGNKVIFIDELPWLSTAKSGFVAALENFWNSWASLRDDIKLVVCGSATSWMIDNIIHSRGGLHNRITHQIVLEPFTLNECEAYFRAYGFSYSRKQIAECYMVMGGIPYYMSLMDKSKSVAQNVDMLFFASNASLKDEFNELYHALFKKANTHIQVVTALATKGKGLTRQEIVKAANVTDNGALSAVLEELEKCGFIRTYEPFGNLQKATDKRQKSDTLFQLIDSYTLFYFDFIVQNKYHDEQFWTTSFNSPIHSTWSGIAFERLCLAHLTQIKKALGISGVQTLACSWRSSSANKSSQIDLLIDRNDDVINVCEIKYYKSKFDIDDLYAEHLRERTALFQRITKTNKALWLTFITTYGLAESANSGEVQNVVVADDLFAT
jgi:AAA+ ATPase superfamily predicted ATPase